jgi:hypothetical protein
LKEAEGNSFHIPRGHLIEDISKIQKGQAGSMDIIQRNQISLQMRMQVLYGNNLFGSSQKTKRILLLEVDAKFIMGVYQCVSITGEQAQTYKINKVIAIILNM